MSTPMSNPFSNPSSPADGFKPADHLEGLLMLRVLAFEEHVPTVHTEPGEKTPAIRVNVAVLDGATAGQEFEDTLIFNKVIIGQLRARVGELVLGRLTRGEAKPGKSAPYIIKDATPADIEAGKAFIATKGNGAAPAPAEQAAAPAPTAMPQPAATSTASVPF
jgi:hypothetical protein